MLAFFKERLVLLSVPKTGTTALEAALRDRADMVFSDPPELKHAPLYRYNRFIRPLFEKVCDARMETVAVMREPVGWLGSWYRYRRRPFMEGRPNATHGIDFDGFVQAYCQGQRPGFADVGSQAKFLEPQPNGTCIDHLFRYEDQDALLAFLEARLQTPVRPGQANVSPRMELSLRPATEAKLRRKCAAEFALYEGIPRAGSGASAVAGPPSR